MTFMIMIMIILYIKISYIIYLEIYYSAAYRSQTRDQQRFTVSEVTAD